jgi:AcrR family transcriptional regulator
MSGAFTVRKSSLLTPRLADKRHMLLNGHMSSKGKHDDRRPRRTAARLVSALEELLGKTGLAAISVRALCEKADVNRTTFYLHYRDVRHLLSEAIADRLEELTADFAPVEAENLNLERPPEQFVKIFRHVRDHAVLYRAFFDEEGISPFQPRLVSVMERVGRGRIADLKRLKRSSGDVADLADRELVVYGGLGALIGVMAWWLRSGMRRSPEYTAERCAWLLVAGTYSLLGLSPPSLDGG